MPFETLDTPVNHARPMRVVCIGVSLALSISTVVEEIMQAGLSGIHLTARITQFGPGIDLQVYDRNA